MSPFETVSQAPAPTPAARIHWPQPVAGMIVGAAMSGSFQSGGIMDVAWNLGSSGIPVWGSSFGAGTHIVTLNRGVLCAQLSPVFIRAIDAGMVFPVTLEDTGQFPPGYRSPEHLRVFILDVVLAMDANALITDETGLLFQGNNSGLPWPTASAQGAFGIVGDDTDANGSMMWRSYFPGGGFPLNINETFRFPPGVLGAMNTFNRFSFQFVQSSAGRNGTVTLFVNEAAVLTRDWTGTLLPVYAGNETQWRPAVRANDVGRSMFVESLDYRAGKFDFNGVVIES